MFHCPKNSCGAFPINATSPRLGRLLTGPGTFGEHLQLQRVNSDPCDSILQMFAFFSFNMNSEAIISGVKSCPQEFCQGESVRTFAPLVSSPLGRRRFTTQGGREDVTVGHLWDGKGSSKVGALSRRVDTQYPSAVVATTVN